MAHKKYHYHPVGIYAITFPHGEIYIGQSRNILSRRSKHFNLKFNRHPKLKECLLKYGVQNCSFDVIYPLPSDVSNEVLDAYESFYIMQFKEAGNELLNMTNGGIGSHGRVLSKETINKIRVANTGKPGTFLGRKHSEESKIKIGIKSRLKAKPKKEKPIPYFTSKVVILDGNTGIFYSLDDASLLTGYSRGHVKNMLNNYRINKTTLSYV